MASDLDELLDMFGMDMKNCQRKILNVLPYSFHERMYIDIYKEIDSMCKDSSLHKGDLKAILHAWGGCCLKKKRMKKKEKMARINSREGLCAKTLETSVLIHPPVTFVAFCEYGEVIITAGSAVLKGKSE